jgi:hypothetical protein
LPGNLHGDVQRERELAEEIGRAIRAGEESEVSQGIGVSVTPFAIAGTPFETRTAVSAESFVSFLEQNFNLSNVNTTSNWRPGRGATILVVQSAKPDHVADGIYRQLAGSAESQFSQKRPALLCVQLRDMTASQLRELIAAPANGLAGIATRLFSGEKRIHLAGVSFVANAGAVTTSRSISDGVLRTSHQDIGAAYVFGNPKNSSADVVNQMFGSGSA